MNKLKPAENKSAYLKAGILGFAGSGKTFTACKIAIGLAKYIKSKKPVGFFDTENGSDYVLPLFRQEKVELVVTKSRAFSDLVEVTREANKACSVLVIDSVSHVWTELVNAFRKQRNIEHMTLRHWQPIKQEWAVFSDLYVNSPLHMIMCGRAGWEYDYEEDSEGVKELTKTGTRMKTEGEMAYEPNLLIEMERTRQQTNKVGTAITHRAWVIKDKCALSTLTGQSFDNPTFENFLPHVKQLNLGGAHEGVDTKANSQALFENNNSRSNEYKRRDIACENIQNEILLRYPGQSAIEKKAKVQLLKDLLETGSWTAIQNMPAVQLEAALKKLIEMPQTPLPTPEKETANA